MKLCSHVVLVKRNTFALSGEVWIAWERPALGPAVLPWAQRGLRCSSRQRSRGPTTMKLCRHAHLVTTNMFALSGEGWIARGSLGRASVARSWGWVARS